MRVTLDKASFTGHETFPFRWRWLKKGVDAAHARGNVFGSDDAIVTLGVGKNMVRSIRHWCLAAGMLSLSASDPVPHGGALTVSELGEHLLLDGGWDPYFDDAASLWLIHWLLVSNSAMATTWYLAFTVLNEPEFARERLVDFIETKATGLSARATRESLTRDVDCFLRTYVPSARSKAVLLEDSLECPLAELGLIQNTEMTDTFRFAIGPKPSLPVAVFGFALAEFMASTVTASRATIAVDHCLYAPGSPGQAFKLDENSLVQLVEQLSGLTDEGIGLSDTAGLRRIYQKATLDPVELLRAHYEGGVTYGAQ